MFAKIRDRMDASVQSQAGAFDKRYAQEAETERKIAAHERALQEQDRIAAERAVIHRQQLKHDLRESHEAQLAYLR